MINAQEYLNLNYPQQKRQEIVELSLKDKNLADQLIVKDFPNLEKIECGNNQELTNIQLINLPQLNYFHANNCQLTSIEIKNCPNINYLNVANNLLTDTRFLEDINSKILTVLSIHTNNFQKQDLSFLRKFNNLEELYLDNCDKEKFRRHIYNRFIGSLKPLQQLSKLEILSIGATDINFGLEYLPKSFRKIGFNTTWKVNTGCAKIRKELEEASQIKGVTEKLIQRDHNSKGKEDPEWISNYYRIAPWREAQNLSGDEAKKIAQQNIQKLLSNYPKNIVFLTIGGRNLEGNLDLKEFTDLEKLDCSDNKLINLDLSKCSKLTHLYCDNNLFTDLEFLNSESEKGLPHPEKLKELYIGNNEKLPQQNLTFLEPFVGLEELNIENCPFKGSLEYLKEMKKLRHISISGTDIDSGLNDLPDSCQTIYCNFDYQSNKRSIEIVKEINKYSEEEGYNLAKWREDKQNDMIASIIPLERLYVIRGNMRQFIKKWGKKDEKNNQNELSKLKSPEELNQERKWKIYLPQFIGRGVAVAGAVLTFRDYSAAGGGILGVYPFAELVISKMEKDFEDKKNKWREFLTDADTFLDNYHELLGILDQFEKDELKTGGVNKALKNLDKNVEIFLSDYDVDGNREIDSEELTTGRNKLAQDLDKGKERKEGEEKSRTWEIIDAIKELETEIIKYRKSSYYGVNKKTNSQLEENQTIQVNVENFGREIIIESQLVNNFDNSTKIPENKNTFSTGSTSQSTISRRRSVNKQQDIEMGIRNKGQQLETYQEIPPK